VADDEAIERTVTVPDTSYIATSGSPPSDRRPGERRTGPGPARGRRPVPTCEPRKGPPLPAGPEHRDLSRETSHSRRPRSPAADPHSAGWEQE